jgi:hypothetical protein
VLRRYGIGYQPRIVVWQFFDGNDLSDAYEFYNWKHDAQDIQPSLFRRYFSHSFLRSIAKRLLGIHGGHPAIVHYYKGPPQHRILRYFYDPQDAAHSPLAFTQTRLVIRKGAELCRQRHIKLVLLYIPTFAQVFQGRIEWLDGHQDDPPQSHEESNAGLEQRLGSICTRLGCTYVDSVPFLRKAACHGKLLYIPVDEHLTTEGNQVINEALQTVLPTLESSNSRNRKERW